MNLSKELANAIRILSVDAVNQAQSGHPGMPLGTVAIFLGMALALPILGLNPIIPFVGAVWLVVICISSYGLTQILETHRPLDAVEKPSSLASLGIFSKKPSAEPSRNEPDDLVPAM